MQRLLCGNIMLKLIPIMPGSPSWSFITFPTTENSFTPPLHLTWYMQNQSIFGKVLAKPRSYLKIFHKFSCQWNQLHHTFQGHDNCWLNPFNWCKDYDEIAKFCNILLIVQQDLWKFTTVWQLHPKYELSESKRNSPTSLWKRYRPL